MPTLLAARPNSDLAARTADRDLTAVRWSRSRRLESGCHEPAAAADVPAGLMMVQQAGVGVLPGMTGRSTQKAGSAVSQGQQEADSATAVGGFSECTKRWPSDGLFLRARTCSAVWVANGFPAARIGTASAEFAEFALRSSPRRLLECPACLLLYALD